MSNPRILIYHRVDNDPLDAQLLCVSPGNFEQQISYLAKHKRTISLKNLLEEVEQDIQIDNSVAITFDDGYLDNLELALPLLEKYRIHATVFVSAGMLGSHYGFWGDIVERIFFTTLDLPGELTLFQDKVLPTSTPQEILQAHDFIRNAFKNMAINEIWEGVEFLRKWSGNQGADMPVRPVINESQLRLLDASPFIEIGAHTMNHPNLSVLSVEEQLQEITASKQLLEKILGKRVNLFAYPYGNVDSFSVDTQQIVLENDFYAGIANIPGDLGAEVDRLAVPRRLVRDWDLQTFISWMGDPDHSNAEQESYQHRCQSLLEVLKFNEKRITEQSSINDFSRNVTASVELNSIVHINTVMGIGGAANSTRRLCQIQKDKGHNASILVSQIFNHSDDNVEVFDPEPDLNIKSLCDIEGWQYFHFQGSHKLWQHAKVKSAELIHLHNLHGDYFNPFSLPILSRVKPIVWTLRDMQSITGHCAHSLDCSGWVSGCKQCPDLTIYPEVAKDRCGDNWSLKYFAYTQSKLQIVVPSQWLMEKVKNSILKDHPVELIYNGVDTTCFRPIDKNTARSKLGLPVDGILVGTASAGSVLTNPWKGGKHFVAVTNALRERYPEITFISIGKHTGHPELNDQGILELPYTNNQEQMALYYSALDFFLYTSIADTCPLVIIEAIACGLPIVSFATGGVPEIARNDHEGYLAPYLDEKELYQAACKMIEADTKTIEQFRNSARNRAVSIFDVNIEYQNYQNLYKKTCAEWQAAKSLPEFPIEELPEFLKTPVFIEAIKTVESSSSQLLMENTAINISQETKDYQAINAKGEQLFAEGQLDDAEKLFLQAISIAPEFVDGYNNLGVLEMEKGHLDEAYQFLFQSYKLDPNSKTTLINFSALLRTVDKNNEANEILSLYLDSNPDDQDIQQLLEQDEQYLTKNMRGEQQYVISAIVSTYDSDQLIAGRLDDLLNQTLADKVEIIVIDSCSPGNEQQIVADYQERYSNIKYLRTNNRESVYQAWNRGLKLSTAPYVTNANTDDRLRSDALEVMVGALEANSEVALVYADYFITTAPIKNFTSHVRSGYCVRPDFHPSIMNSGCHMGPQPVWRKEIHSHLGYFDESYRSAADYEFWCRIAIQYPMLHINKFLGVYYHNPAGIVNSNGELSVNETQQIKQKYAHNFPLGNAVPVPDYYYHQPWQGSEYVNIGMVTYNRLEFTRQAIESLVKHTRFPHVISVIDNNSQDGTQQYLTQLYEQGIIKNLILLKENIGVAKASNIAWQCEPDAGYYLKYDNDIIIQKPDWLKNLVEVTNGVKQLGVVGYNFEPVGYELKEIDGFKIRPKPRGANVGGACILIPKKMHDRLGFWCEDYGLYGEEDYDYGIRVTLSGLLNVYMEDEDIGFHLPAGKAAAIDQHSFIAKDGLEESLDKAYREAKDVHRANNMAPDGPVQKNLEAYQNHPDRVYVATAGLTNDIFNLVFPESLKEQILKHNGQQRAPSISGDESIKANDLDLIQQLGFVSGLEAACQVLITISEITDDSIFNTAVTASATHSKFISKYAVTKDELFLQLAQIVKDKAIEKVEHDQGLLNQALQFLYAIDHQSVYFEKSIALKATVRQLLDDLQYQIWVKNHSLLEVDAELFAERMMLKWQNKPGFHLLMLLFPEEQALLADTLDSLGKQFYQEWGLTVISELPVPDPIFEQEDFLNWVQIAGNDDPYELLNALISDVESDWVAIIEPGATFEPQTFIHIADYINIKPKWKLIYTDEDSLEKDDVGNDIRTAAKFKPDFNLDLLRSTPYMGHFCVVERASLLEMGGFSADFGLENYDAAFRYYENYGEQGVGHISDVLFHQPITSTRRVAEEHIQNIVKRHLQRNLIDADVEAGYLPESCRITYQHQQTPKVSIIIPTKDKLEYLEPCIESLLEKTEYPNFEVIIVDNQSSDPDVVEYYSALKQRHPEKIRVIDYPHPFNFSAICNYAADQAEGEYLLLLNNDTEILHKEWLGRMMMHAMRDDVGAVGARLVYPESGLLQHAGIVMGMDTIADHPFIGQLHIKEPGYMGRALLDQNYSAVTGACLLIEKNIYQSVKGMDEENFAVSYNDVDLCLKTREAGYRVVWTPYSTLVHHGNVTQNSTAASKEKIERFKDEREAMFKKWQPIISEDPAFNRQLSLTQRDFSVEAAMPCNWDVNFHDRLRIFGIPIEGGAGDYRLIQPFNGLRKSGLAQCEYLRLQNNAKDRINVSEIARQKPDVVVFHSSITDTNLKLLEQCRTLLPDIFLIYMIDDLIDQVPKKSSAYRTIKRSFRDAKPRIRRALSNCDRVIVSTEPLAKFCRGMIDDIKIVPNSLERDVWLGLESKRQQGNKLRVGWAGALQHQGDLDMIAEVVKQTASEVDWVFMGMRPESIKPYIKEFHESVDISDYPKVLAGLNLDLAIAPLEDNSFNEAKSNLRLLEYGILGWPVICSDVYPYRGTPVTCVENTTEEWLAAIRQAIDYPDDLPKQGDRLRQWVTADYMLEDNLEYWLNALKPKS